MVTLLLIVLRFLAAFDTANHFLLLKLSFSSLVFGDNTLSHSHLPDSPCSLSSAGVSWGGSAGP